MIEVTYKSSSELKLSIVSVRTGEDKELVLGSLTCLSLWYIMHPWTRTCRILNVSWILYPVKSLIPKPLSSFESLTF